MDRRNRIVYLESKVLRPFKRMAEVSLDHPTVAGRVAGLSPEQVAGLRPCNEPELCFAEPGGTFPFRYRVELIDQEGNFVAKPCGDWSLIF